MLHLPVNEFHPGIAEIVEPFQYIRIENEKGQDIPRLLQGTEQPVIIEQAKVSPEPEYIDYGRLFHGAVKKKEGKGMDCKINNFAKKGLYRI